MFKYKVLVTARSFGKSDDLAINFLKENGCQVIRISDGAETVAEQLKRQIKDADAVIAGLEAYDKQLIDSAAKLKVISRYGVGYDKIDITYAKQKGIKVAVTLGANEDSVADMAVGLMLSAARNIPFMDKTMKEKNAQRPQGVEMFGKTLGIVGTGRIGKGVVRRCKGFNMNVLCYDIYKDQQFAAEYGAKYVDLETLIKESDFISIHLPLNQKTQNMFTAAEFNMMKKDAIIVNTARGGIINEQDLYQALKNKVIRAAALDVTVNEPPYEDDILKLDNCIVTPHAGAATKQASSKMSLLAAKNAVAVLEGKECKYVIN